MNCQVVRMYFLPILMHFPCNRGSLDKAKHFLWMFILSKKKCRWKGELDVNKHYFCQQKLRYPYFTISIKLEHRKKLQKRHAWAWPRILNWRKWELNYVKGNTRKYLFVISKLILWLTHIQFNCFRQYFKGTINVLLKKIFLIEFWRNQFINKILN